jgi:GTP pyrophosphokinase
MTFGRRSILARMLISWLMAVISRVAVIVARFVCWASADLGYVRSARSKSKIRRWFRQQNREENIAFGREQLRKELKRLNLADGIRMQDVAHMYDYKSVDDFYAALGFGDLNSQRVAARILQELRSQEVFTQEEEKDVAVTPEGIRVKGVGDLMTQLAQCCKPNPDDGGPIVGYVTRGRGVTIHKWDCPNILIRTSKGEVERLIEVDWGTGQTRVYPVVIKIRAWDRDGLLRDIATVIAEEGINMREVSSVSVQKTNLVTLTATLEITNFNQLVSILDKIERLSNVIEVNREPSHRPPPAPRLMPLD